VHHLNLLIETGFFTIARSDAFVGHPPFGVGSALAGLYRSSGNQIRRTAFLPLYPNPAKIVFKSSRHSGSTE